MWVVVLSGVGFLAAALAVAWPYLPAAPKPASSAVNRADWVNRLFVLVEQSDASGSEAVSAAARSLIAALVDEKKG